MNKDGKFSLMEATATLSSSGKLQVQFVHLLNKYSVGTPIL